jgi:hypothetical protein
VYVVLVSEVQMFEEQDNLAADLKAFANTEVPKVTGGMVLVLTMLMTCLGSASVS